MAASSRAQVLRLYRALLRESQRFSGYGYRTYAIRRIKDAFRENKNIADSEKIEELLNKAKANLEVIQRQNSLYRSLNFVAVQRDAAGKSFGSVDQG
ncbi:LYR motif-containing protein 4 isoform X1 [Motacilla alba alba]|uniref:LYR motif-containing protein 4 isoform X1 n=1 Tax=Motacilla alba alba TaxID=1094192 RepID=UPI0018D56CC8|nr:LYR motif-containing protein 4 isoform X1 [Motacilla alba alba]